MGGVCGIAIVRNNRHSRQEADVRSIIVVTTPFPSSGLINTNIGGRGLARSILDIVVQYARQRSV